MPAPPPADRPAAPPDLRPPRPTPVPAPPPAPQPQLPPWRPLGRRQRLLVVLLTLATVAALSVLMLRHQARVLGAKAAREVAAVPGRPDCAASAAVGAQGPRPAGCPGSPMPVRVLPPR